jgi:hypothetical protein
MHNTSPDFLCWYSHKLEVKAMTPVAVVEAGGWLISITAVSELADDFVRVAITVP